jgi:ketosteroid isomerase-like protein
MQPYGTAFEQVGDAVVVAGGCVVRGRGSGAETDSPMAWVVRVIDGKIVSHRGFSDVQIAMSAAAEESSGG